MTDNTVNFSKYVADHIMDTVYNDINQGIEDDLISYLPRVEDSKGEFLRRINVIFLDYAINRSGEFKNPGKATQKAHLCCRISKRLYELNDKLEKRDC